MVHGQDFIVSYPVWCACIHVCVYVCICGDIYCFHLAKMLCIEALPGKMKDAIQRVFPSKAFFPGECIFSATLYIIMFIACNFLYLAHQQQLYSEQNFDWVHWFVQGRLQILNVSHCCLLQLLLTIRDITYTYIIEASGKLKDGCNQSLLKYPRGERKI